MNTLLLPGVNVYSCASTDVSEGEEGDGEPYGKSLSVSVMQTRSWKRVDVFVSRPFHSMRLFCSATWPVDALPSWTECYNIDIWPWHELCASLVGCEKKKKFHSLSEIATTKAKLLERKKEENTTSSTIRKETTQFVLSSSFPTQTRLDSKTRWTCTAAAWAFVSFSHNHMNCSILVAIGRGRERRSRNESDQNVITP